MRKLFLIVVCILIGSLKLLCQEWKRIYGGSLNTIINNIYEHYDRGIIMSGMQYDNTYHPLGHLMKTDINGYLRWSRSFGIPLKYINFFGSRLTTDGGLIAIGMTDMIQNSCKDPIVIKVNVCGEKEWCKIYDAPGCNAVGMDIEAIQNGDYIALLNGWKSGDQEQIWLFRLDSLGEVVWSQVYATNPAFSSEISYSLSKTSDSCVIITGEAYYPDPTYPGKSIIKIILIRVALDGTSIFEVPWGTNNGVYSDGRQSVVDSKNNIYTAGRRARTTAPGGDSPCLFKTSMNGEPVFYTDLKSASVAGMTSTLKWFADSTLASVSQWHNSSGPDTTAVIKTDSLGNFITQKTLTTLSEYAIWGSDITYNNSLILGGYFKNSGVINGCAFKLNSDLEYDSVYTRPFTYDSLCPHPIVSDTVPLDDCEVVIVGLDDAEQHPEKTRLHIYPNPAGGQVNIVLPQYLVRHNPGSILSSTTTWFQWDKTRLDILSITGKLMFTMEIPKQQATVQVNTSAWPAGMYFARVVFMNESVAEGKLVVE
ncbi:MAG: T9SS type A sorting domain-containing protein [Alphaproteobacteria bacterium]|nr:T9SS type A sorting domain-containing protein [Alphaproteobacteria bacterium]